MPGDTLSKLVLLIPATPLESWFYYLCPKSQIDGVRSILPLETDLWWLKRRYIKSHFKIH
jgi:hypothetical protein